MSDSSEKTGGRKLTAQNRGAPGDKSGMGSAVLLLALSAVLLTVALGKLARGPESVQVAAHMAESARAGSAEDESADAEGAAGAAPGGRRQQWPGDDAANWIKGAGALNIPSMLGATEADGASPADQWPMWRGGLRQCGASRSNLPENLRRQWTYEHATGEIITTAAIYDGRAYVSTEDGYLLALDMEDGQLAWSYELGARCWSAPTVAGDLVLVGDKEGVLHAVDRRSGEMRWRHSRSHELANSQVLGQLVLTGGYDDRLQALRLEDGGEAWSWQTDERVVAPTTVLGDRLVSGGCNGRISILAAADGELLEEVELEAQVGAAMPWDGRGLHVMTFDGLLSRLEMVEAAEGEAAGDVADDSDDAERPAVGSWQTVWQVDYRQPGALVVTHHEPQSPALFGDRLVAGFFDGWVRCLRTSDGGLFWVRRPGDGIEGSVVIVGNLVLMGDSGGTFFVLSLEDGRTLWKDIVGGSLIASPAVADRRVVISSTSGTIVCYGP